MLASAALGVAGGRRLPSADPEDAIDVQSVPGSQKKALHLAAPSVSAFADSHASSPELTGSRQPATVQNAAAETAQRAENRSPIESSQHVNTDASSFPSAEQLWEGAWKAFEDSAPVQGLPDPESLQILLARDQQLESQHHSSFPSLAARFFRQGKPSGAQNRRHGMHCLACQKICCLLLAKRPQYLVCSPSCALLDALQLFARMRYQNGVLDILCYMFTLS